MLIVFIDNLLCFLSILNELSFHGSSFEVAFYVCLSKSISYAGALCYHQYKSLEFLIATSSTCYLTFNLQSAYSGYSIFFFLQCYHWSSIIVVLIPGGSVGNSPYPSFQLW